MAGVAQQLGRLALIGFVAALIMGMGVTDVVLPRAVTALARARRPRGVGPGGEVGDALKSASPLRPAGG